jgi:UDP-N-acetylglucosamine acyltransferase
MATNIHPTAIVAPGARLGDNVSVGPYSIIGEHVEIGDNTWVGPHVVIEGHTSIGRDNRFFQFCSIGAINQDKKYKGEPTRVEIGDRNTFRESCTVHIGTTQDKLVTRVGNDNWVMAYVHIAHDCIVGNNTTFANCAQLAGHVEVGDWAVLGGFSGVHQFCKIGAHVMTAVGSVILQDIPPYVMAAGNTATPFGINAEGLKRRGFTAPQLQAIKRAYRTLYRSGLSLDEAKEKLREDAGKEAVVQPLVDFLDQSQRGIIR